MRHRLFAVSVLLTALWAAVLGAQATRRAPEANLQHPCASTIPVDLRAGRIGGVHVDTTVDAVVAALGADHVVRRDRRAEGHQEKAYEVTICGHRIGRLWSGVVIRDTAFRTLEGVGPGSRVAAFDSAYGKPEISMEEGTSLRYSVRSANLNLLVEVPGPCYGFDGGRAVRVDPACRATQIWFPLHHMLQE
jgi:hypothetical protein